jgi:hypothetical protein
MVEELNQGLKMSVLRNIDRQIEPVEIWWQRLDPARARSLSTDPPLREKLGVLSLCGDELE